MNLSREQLLDVYAGTNMSSDKVNAIVNGNIIKDSGIANYILFEDSPIHTVQEVFDSLIPISEYIDQNPNIYFACKALNYRTYSQKYDGNRPLAVYVNWSISENKLCSCLGFDQPLLCTGKDAYQKLLSALNKLGISSTEDLNASNVYPPEIIWE